ncbi:ferredoxin Fer [Haladaptatus sp. NG-SE-30]
MDSPFEILGIDSDADDTEIVQAYRQRVKEAHPDHDGSMSEFQVVRLAYEQIQAGYDGEQWETEPESVGEQSQPETSQVEYLNYEVLDDFQWDLDDDDLFEKASAEGLDPADYGQISVQPHECLLEAVEEQGFTWPYSCRGGACANCAVAVMEGKLSMPVDHILPPEMMDRNIRLSCNGIPTTDELKIVYNVKHLPDLDELRLPPHPSDKARSNGSG